ncbi:hypothetical protein ACP4OV_003134 [Aristida adscensionis]
METPTGMEAPRLSDELTPGKGHASRKSLASNAARVISKYRHSRLQKSQLPVKGTRFKINCRCQPKCVVSVIKNFDEQKKELVRQIGFGGILDLKLTKVNRQFGAWLLSKVDPKASVELCSQEEANIRKEVICDIFEIPRFSALTVTLLEKVLMKQYSYPLSIDEKRAFKAAFVFYVMTKLLAPQSLANFISPRYIRAVADVDNISEYDWCKFIVDDILKSAGLMFRRFTRTSEGSIMGCIVFLQVLYLSRLDVGYVLASNDASHGIAIFEDAQVEKMILADMVTRTNPGYPFPKYGKLQLRNSPIFSSTQSLDKSNIKGKKSGSPCMDCVSEYVQRRFKSKKVSAVMGIEAQSEIIRMVEDALTQCYKILDDNSDFVIKPDDPAAIKASDNFRSVLEQTIFGTTRIAVIATLRNVLGSSQEDSDAPDGPLSDGSKHICHAGYGMPNCTETPGSNTPVNPVHGDQNNGVSCEPRSGVENTTSTQQNPSGHCSFAGVDPPSFDLGIEEEFNTPTKSLAHPDDSSKKRTTTVSPTTNMRIQKQCLLDLLDENGDEDYKRRNYTVQNPHSHMLRKRTKCPIRPSKNLRSPFISKHCIVESLIELFAVAGEHFWNPEHQLAHFIGNDILYDVTECHLILMPIHLFNHYAVYAFDMENKKLSILDSLMQEGPLHEDLFSRHATLRVIISNCLSQCLALAFPGWSEEISTWEYEIVRRIPKQNNGDDCGFLSFNYLSGWNGQRLISTVSEDTLALRKQFMMQLLTFEGNEASLPDFVKKQLRRIRN